MALVRLISIVKLQTEKKRIVCYMVIVAVYEDEQMVVVCRWEKMCMDTQRTPKKKVSSLPMDGEINRVIILYCLRRIPGNCYLWKSMSLLYTKLW